MRQLFIITITVTIAASTNARAPVEPPAFVLIVGNNHSLDRGVKPLRYADDDALRYYELFSLRAHRLALFTVLDGDTARLYPRLARKARVPTKKAITSLLDRWNEEMARLRKAGKHPELTVIYAGHGDVDSSGQGYVNLQRSKLTRRDLYRQIILPSTASYVHLIVDACKSYFLLNQRGWKKDSAQNNHQATIRAFLRKEKLDAHPRVGAILATSGDNSTHEWSRYRGGILSHELRSGLAGAADINGDGRVEYSEIHAFIAAANARIRNAKARLRIFAHAPAADRHRPLFRIRRSRNARLLKFSQALRGRFYLEDRRGVRTVDLHKARGHAFALLVSRKKTYQMIHDDKAAHLPAGARALSVSQLSFTKPPRLAARSASLDATFRRDLYRLPYSRGFYDGFVAQQGYLPVAPTTHKKADAQAGGAKTGPAATWEQRKPSSGKRQDLRPTVAVLYFDYEGTDSNLAVLRKGIAEMLIADLSQVPGVRVVERLRLEALLKELKLQRSRAFDRRTAIRIGRQLGAKYLIWGRYWRLGAFCLVGKVVSVETGAILPSASHCGNESAFLETFRQVSGAIKTTVETKLEGFEKRHMKKRRVLRVRKRASKRPKGPVRLTTRLAVRYARALDAKDRGDAPTARKELKQLLQEQPDFKPARRMLARLTPRSR